MALDLNPAQKEAVLHAGGPLLCLAGAGSGKTRVITHRLAELIRRGVHPSRILAVTFTNKAAQEMRERTERLLGRTVAPLWIGTFHATFARLLRSHAERAGLPRDFLIFDDSDQLALCTQLIRELGLSDLVVPRAILAAIVQAKNRGVLPGEYAATDYFTELVKKVYPRYQERLRALGAADFGDLLLIPLTLCRTDAEVAQVLAARFDQALVDEFQDVNTVQYQLLLHLCRGSRQLFVVGDDDQAIYGWRGADVRNLLALERDFPEVRIVKLEQNYRSTQVILQAANAVIARNPRPHPKHLFTEQEGGERIVYYPAPDERREAFFVAQTIRQLESEEGRELADFAVFYRTNAQSRVLEEALRTCDLPYTVIGGTRFYDRAEIKDLLCYLRLCHNPADEVALRRVINVPPRGIGEATFAKIEGRARLGGVTLWQALGDLLHTDGALSTGPRRKLAEFVQLIEDLRELSHSVGLPALLQEILQRTGYLERLSIDGGPEAEARRENVMELCGSIKERPDLSLVDYLEQISLVSSVDQAARGVALMTVHAAKGLEFPVVFVTGLEDGLFPSLRQRGDNLSESEDPVVEERRLAYVALTRARERLILTCAQTRRLFGQAPRLAEPSRFIREIPDECLQKTVVRERERTWRPVREEPAPPAAEPDTELRVEYDLDEAPFQLGQKVRHPQLGVGEIRAFSMGGRLVVYFPQVGPRSIMARYLEPA